MMPNETKSSPYIDGLGNSTLGLLVETGCPVAYGNLNLDVDALGKTA